jgi:RNA-directed DNA polymerase
MPREEEPAMLTTELAREDVLWASWARVAAGTSVPGVDGVTPASFGRELPGQLDELRDELLGGRYQSSPLRSLTINKNGRRRRLGLPTVRDRIVQRALLRVEDRALGGADAESSFAYRRGRSWVDALQRAAEYRDRGLRVVARADVREFFGLFAVDGVARVRRRWGRVLGASARGRVEVFR